MLPCSAGETDHPKQTQPIAASVPSMLPYSADETDNPKQRQERQDRTDSKPRTASAAPTCLRFGPSSWELNPQSRGRGQTTWDSNPPQAQCRPSARHDRPAGRQSSRLKAGKQAGMQASAPTDRQTGKHTVACRSNTGNCQGDTLSRDSLELALRRA